MLEMARIARKQGLDVVIGIVETHGRSDTQALLGEIETLPLRQQRYQNRLFAELDTDALIQRRPQLALIDELAHSNVPGSRHVKRHQDVEDVLAAGIDVWTTLNVQHLESLNDVVTRITGVRVRETLPDTVLARADDIELVDLPSGELLRRLDEGKIYLGDHARQAREHFFTPANLTALRELALRAAADRVDSQMQSLLRRHSVQGPWPTRDRLLVCVGGNSVGKRLVRSAARLANQRGVQWIAIHVINSRANTLSDEAKDRIAEVLRLAEELGAEALTLPGEHVAREILDFARARNVTQIVIGQPRRPRMQRLLGRSVAHALALNAQDIEVTLVPRETDRNLDKTPSPGVLALLAAENGRDYAKALLATALATGVGVVVEKLVGLHNLTMVYLLAVMLIALRIGLLASVFTALTSAVCFNYFFIEPRYTLMMEHRQDAFTLGLLLAAAVFTGQVGRQIKGQMEALRKTARRTSNLNEFTRKVAAALGREEVLLAITNHIESTLQCACAVIPEPPTEGMIAVARRGIGADFQWPDTARAAAQWSWEHVQPAGYGTATLPAADWLFVPMRASRRVVGLLALEMRDRNRPFSAGQKRLLDAIADQAAVALERVLLVHEVEEKRIAGEAEQLRAALLASVSHDLRTPLVSILGAASSLRSQSSKLDAQASDQLLETIEEEAERLNRFVQNLLDMTRLGHGKLKPRLDWCDLRDLIRQAQSRLARQLAGFEVKLECDPQLSLAQLDPMLIEQVFVNLLDNAAKYSPKDGTIRIGCRAQREDFVIDVEDQGPGIPVADRERVFDPFYRVQAKDHVQPGTGLGLSICRGILDAHGGSIRALSRARGDGTLMRITLPRAADAHATATARMPRHG